MAVLLWPAEAGLKAFTALFKAVGSLLKDLRHTVAKPVSASGTAVIEATCQTESMSVSSAPATATPPATGGAIQIHAGGVACSYK